MWQISRKYAARRELIRLCKTSLRLQKRDLGQISIKTTEPGTDLVRRMLLSQFCMACFQNLRGALGAFRKGDNYIPSVLSRNIIEYFITWQYIEKNPETRVLQFVDASLNRQLTFNKIIEKLSEKQPNLFDIEPERIKKRKSELKRQIDAGRESHGGWNKLIELRAKDVGLEDLYQMPYRLLSTITHPDAQQSENYFVDGKGTSVKICEFKDLRGNASLSIGTGLRLVNMMFSQLAGLVDIPNQDQYPVLIQRIDDHQRKWNSSR